MRVDWIVPHLLAGSCRPGLLEDLDADLEQLRRLGIRLIVNLTEEQPVPELEDQGFATVHFPIPDMGVTTPRRLLPVLLQVLEQAEGGKPVLFHCKAGLGRTGMVLACCLVLRGETAEAAIRRVRAINGHFIQNFRQERFVADFAEHLASLPE